MNLSPEQPVLGFLSIMKWNLFQKPTILYILVINLNKRVNSPSIIFFSTISIFQINNNNRNSKERKNSSGISKICSTINKWQKPNARMRPLSKKPSPTEKLTSAVFLLYRQAYQLTQTLVIKICMIYNNHFFFFFYLRWERSSYFPTVRFTRRLFPWFLSSFSFSSLKSYYPFFC